MFGENYEQMFGNRSEFEQCQNSTPPELNCCCDFVFSAQDMAKAIPLGIIQGLCHAIGLIGIWKNNIQKTEQDAGNSEKTRWEHIKEYVKDNYQTWLYYCLVFVIPPGIGSIGHLCIEGLDVRLLDSSNTLFTFVFTVIFALGFYSDANYDTEESILLGASALVSFGGNCMILAHMPYEENYNFHDYFHYLIQNRVLIYLIISFMISLICYVGNRKLMNIKRFPFKRDTDREELISSERNVDDVQEMGEENKLSAKEFTLSVLEKFQFLTQALFLMSANTIINVAVKSGVYLLLQWYHVKFIFGELFIIPLLIIAVASILFFLKRSLTYKDLIYMTVIVCDLDVINRAIFVSFIYIENISCSYFDQTQFWGSVSVIVIGFVGFITTPGQIVKN